MNHRMCFSLNQSIYTDFFVEQQPKKKNYREWLSLMTSEIHPLPGNSVAPGEPGGARTSLQLDAGFILWPDGDDPSRGWSGGGK